MARERAVRPYLCGTPAEAIGPIPCIFRRLFTPSFPIELCLRKNYLLGYYSNNVTEVLQQVDPSNKHKTYCRVW